MLPKEALLADIGGTNARFTLTSDGRRGEIKRLRVADHPGPVEAIRAALSQWALERPPTVAALAVAGPVEEGRARLTNGLWEIDRAELIRAFGFDQVHVVNDFAAVAWSLPALQSEHLVSIGGGGAVAGAPAAVIGPGTGLGVAGFVPAEPDPVVLVTEGGHVTMAPTSDWESQILDHLRRRFGHVSAERVVSGEGLVNLYQAIAALEGSEAPIDSASAIVEGARSGESTLCSIAVETFCAMLGTVAGNLALTLGARGGIYIAGGILPRMTELFASSPFRARFEAKGRFQGYLSAVPTWLIVGPSPAFLGLEELVRRKGEASTET